MTNEEKFAQDKKIADFRQSLNTMSPGGVQATGIAMVLMGEATDRYGLPAHKAAVVAELLAQGDPSINF